MHELEEHICGANNSKGTTEVKELAGVKIRTFSVVQYLYEPNEIKFSFHPNVELRILRIKPLYIKHLYRVVRTLIVYRIKLISIER